jgi:hypothetical protein
MLARERLVDDDDPPPRSREQLETLFLTRLMEIDAAIWSRWMRDV